MCYNVPVKIVYLFRFYNSYKVFFPCQISMYCTPVMINEILEWRASLRIFLSPQARPGFRLTNLTEINKNEKLEMKNENVQRAGEAENGLQQMFFRAPALVDFNKFSEIISINHFTFCMVSFSKSLW